MSHPAVDRRAALKARHRRAIVDAAAALIGESGGTRFSVDELAERADVSRRTVFNHFASLDDVVTEVCSEVVGAALDRLDAIASDQRGGQDQPVGRDHDSPRDGQGERGADVTLFDEVADALRSTDFVTPLVYLTRVLGDEGGPSPRRAFTLIKVFADVSMRLTAALAASHPDADPFDVELLVGSLMSGLIVVYLRWVEVTGAVDDPAARRAWTDLLQRLLDATRTGHEPVASSRRTR
ncbi:TetR/AcrR family transcriptional regulator [Oerskovia turbata]|uniref:TetR/AcrR family transcriptional regulator n=1 Tax=Oerskovia turbata TaxID=1713 RepID=A0A4Q1KUC6_9CELL|nr:TetR/AcrR family transcriptional regulator [Oerskovia turbata]RXR25759.1 TetR/AcrR family transcriptional regulator [Oerskovia turbata]RXR33325.1 TetR/AcrR family transcriptional regulator [Oerskovia turbata]TGJ96222.1 TetR/AcrR family transcriptional regulator [Actinotalea fermentans ATCC 43279 = JCM 9966 = DSM 3133]